MSVKFDYLTFERRQLLHLLWVTLYTNAVVFQKVTQSNFFTRFKLLYNENNLDDLNKNFNEIRKLENMNQSRL